VRTVQEAGINRILAVLKLVGPPAGASPERGRGHWLVLQTLRAAIGILVAAFAIMVVLMLATPSVTDAPTIAKSLAQQRGTAFPGPVPPRRFVVALVATEDQRFFSPLDPGVDPVAILRVVIGRAAGFPDQGGSTVDQQLAKMLHSPGEHGLLVELERVAIALKLNFAYSRIALLTMYAEVAYYDTDITGSRPPVAAISEGRQGT
jgi:membrane peptidoglycan carboxypeptidase